MQDELPRGELVRKIPTSELWSNIKKPAEPSAFRKDMDDATFHASFELSADQHRLLVNHIGIVQTSFRVSRYFSDPFNKCGFCTGTLTVFININLY